MNNLTLREFMYKASVLVNAIDDLKKHMEEGQFTLYMALINENEYFIHLFKVNQQFHEFFSSDKMKKEVMIDLDKVICECNAEVCHRSK